jgi:hypothetical protein
MLITQIFLTNKKLKNETIGFGLAPDTAPKVETNIIDPKLRLETAIANIDADTANQNAEFNNILQELYVLGASHDIVQKLALIMNNVASNSFDRGGIVNEMNNTNSNSLRRQIGFARNELN